MSIKKNQVLRASRGLTSRRTAKIVSMVVPRLGDWKDMSKSGISEELAEIATDKQFETALVMLQHFVKHEHDERFLLLRFRYRADAETVLGRIGNWVQVVKGQIHENGLQKWLLAVDYRGNVLSQGHLALILGAEQ